MKKLLLGILCLGLAGAGVMYLTSCALQKGPLSPNTSLLGGGSGLQTQFNVSSTDLGTPMSVSKTGRVFMTAAVNPATVNSSTVQLFTEADDGLSETAYPYVVVSYDSALRAIVLTPDPAHNNGYWDNSKYFHLLLTTGLTSASGQPLDGNGNGIAEGPTFDNVDEFFWTNAPLAPGYATGPVQIAGLILAAPNGPFNITTGNAGNVQVLYSYVTLTVAFNNNVDQSTVWVDANTLHNNIVFHDGNGANVAPVAGSVTRTANTIVAAFNLAGRASYSVFVRGGLSGVRSRQEPFDLLFRGRYFDGAGSSNGNPNGVAEASDDLKPKYIFTQNPDGTTSAPPTLNSCTYDAGNRRWIITFNVPTGNGLMNAASLNSTNLQLLSGTNTTFSSSPGQVYGTIAPESINYDISSGTLYIYLPRHFATNRSDGAYPYNYAYIKVMLTKDLLSNDGLPFDGDGDGVGGLNTDNYLAGNGGVNAAKVYSYDY